MSTKLKFEKVERFIGAGDLAAEEGLELATVVRSSILSRMDHARASIEEDLEEYSKHIAESGKFAEQDRILRLWVDFHKSLLAIGAGAEEIESSLKFGFAITGQPLPKVESEDASKKETVVLDLSPEEEFHKKLEQGEEAPIPESMIEWEDEEDSKGAEPPSQELIAKIIKLMAKAGTRKHGIKAAWADGEIMYGLEKAASGFDDNSIYDAVRYLVKQGIIIEAQLGNINSKNFWLVDTYEDYLAKFDDVVVEEEISIVDTIKKLLVSNKDAKNLVVPWSLNELFFAARDVHPGVSREDIVRSIEQIEECHEESPEVYRWVIGSNGKRSTPLPVLSVSSSQENVISVAAEAIYGVLRSEMVAGRGTRIWKDYDIIGLHGRGSEFGRSLKDEYLNPEVVKKALALLVEQKKVELVRASPERPWLKQDGWKVIP